MVPRKKIDLGKLNDASFWYPINLLEGEGLGTTYEYLDKLAFLNNTFSQKKLKRVVIAGLPWKYGFSLDLILFSYFSGASEIHILDTREEKLNKLRTLLIDNCLPKKLSEHTVLHKVTQEQISSPKYYKTHFRHIDLLANSEVVHNWNIQTLGSWLAGLSSVANQIAIFSPNKGNNAHMSISHLKSLSLKQMDMLARLVNKNARVTTGYIDMPPFPPGIKRSEKQKGDLQDPRILYLLNVLFLFWRFTQKTVFRFLLKKSAHIVYLLASKK